VGDLLKTETIGLSLFFAVPGLIIIYIRGQFVPNRRQSLADSSLNYITLSLVYQAIVFSITDASVGTRYAPWLNNLAWPGLLFLGPAILGGVIGLNARQGWTRWLLAKLKINTSHPIDTAWDWRFSGCETCWVLATLKDGTKWAGYLGDGSFMSTDADERDLYLDHVYEIGSDYMWTPKGSGVWIASGELQSIEFWSTKVDTHDEDFQN